MKILHVVASVDPVHGGVAASILHRGMRLVALGHEVEVASLDAPNSVAGQHYPFPLHALGPGRTSWNYSHKLKPWLRQNAGRFDAVVVDGLWQYLSVAVRRALAGLGVPYYVFPHGMLDPWFKRSFPLKHLKKWLFWPWAEYLLLRDAHKVLFTCEEERLLARESFWLYRAKESIVTLGTNVPALPDADLALAFREQVPGLLPESPPLLFLGRIHPKKGCDLLLHAFAAVADANPGLHLVMAGPMESGYGLELRTLAQDLGLDHRVHWPGMLQGHAKWGALRAARAFVLPSHQENFGIAVVEALGCGTPVLISNKVNIWREIEADQCGLIGEDTQEGTTSLLQRFLGLDSSQQLQMALHARRSFEQRFTADGAAQEFLMALTPA